MNEGAFLSDSLCVPKSIFGSGNNSLNNNTMATMIISKISKNYSFFFPFLNKKRGFRCEVILVGF